MLKQLRKRTDGFTIIEVMIVLAIAGLILLIVFLAVPALQRNSRNTSRKNDIASILGAITEYTNNNSGSLPADQTVVQCGDALVDPCTTLLTLTKRGYYITDGNFLIGTGAFTNASNIDQVSIYKGATCSGANAIAAGTSRAVVALFALEASGSGGTVRQCQEG